MAEGFTAIGGNGTVEELRLDSNGLRVLLLPDPTVPVVAVSVVYHVGSRNEAVGHTGATHLLEHLMFKGSSRFDPLAGRGVARVLERVGAAFNATTWFDRTNYYETLPAEQLELALEIEADRMRSALLREADLANEVTVVLNEFERGENEPFEALLKDSFAIAFREHPYHHPTIGWRSDIERASIARLRSFYDTFYHPDNATLIVVGSFDREAALGLIARHYGPLPAAPTAIERSVTAEPQQQGERRFVIRRAGEVGWVVVSWRTPEAAHPDTHALAVLADALTAGVTSRLFQRLVDGGRCLEVQAIAWQLRDPGLFQVFAPLAPGTPHEEIEAAIREAIAEIARDGVTEEELARARVQVEAQTAYHRDSPTQVAAALAEAVSAADWRFYTDYLEKVRAVTADDVRRVAGRYFDDDALTVGYFVPRNGGGQAAHVPAPSPQPLLPAPCGLHGSVADRVSSAALPGGARALILRRPGNPTVHLHGSLLAGHGLLGADRWSAASLVPDMLERGTSRRGRLELAATLEDRGIELDVSGEAFNPLEVFVSGRCLSRHLDLTLEILFETLREPSFPAEELERVRQLRLGELAQLSEDTFQRAFDSFSRLVFPPEHPFHRRRLDERRAGLEELGRDDLRDVHRRLYGPASLVLALVGDLDPDAAFGHLARLLDGWQGGLAAPPRVVRRGPGDGAVGETRESMADKPNLDVVLGHPGGLRRTDPDFLAAMLGNAILGQSTLSSRLGRRLRDQEALTYGVISRFFGASLLDGPWAATFSVSPADLERGLAAARDEIARLVEDGPGEEELADERAALAGGYQVGLATPAGLAREIARLARHGLPLETIDTLPGQVLGLGRGAVHAALRAHVQPDRCAVAVAGSLVDSEPDEG